MTKVHQLIRLMHDLDSGYDPTSVKIEGGRTVLAPDRPVQGRVETLFTDDFDDEAAGLPDCPELFIPTAVPIATVLPPDRTQGHVRAYISDPRTNRSVSCASTLERICALSLIANSEIDAIEDQPAALYYANSKNEEHSHRVDYRFRLRHSGYVIAAAVRPYRLLEKGDLKNTIERINEGYLDGFADEVVILTEHELTYALGWNSKFILRSLRGRNEEHCARLLPRLATMHGWFSVRTLIDGLLPEAHGWNAVMCLIFDGLLRPFRRDQLLPNFPIISVNKTMERYR